MTNREVREWYLARNAAIRARDAELGAAGVSLEERARRDFEARHQARLEARGMMEDAAEVADLGRRDGAKYGDPDGPSFEY